MCDPFWRTLTLRLCVLWQLRMREGKDDAESVALADAFAVTVQGVAAGMGWTG